MNHFLLTMESSNKSCLFLSFVLQVSVANITFLYLYLAFPFSFLLCLITSTVDSFIPHFYISYKTVCSIGDC